MQMRNGLKGVSIIRSLISFAVIIRLDLILSVLFSNSKAVETRCGAKAFRNGAGVPWSKRIFTLRGGQTLLRVLKNGLDVIASHTGKPFEKLVHRGPRFKILEESAYWDPRALE
jgi:hypothetical protein